MFYNTWLANRRYDILLCEDYYYTRRCHICMYDILLCEDYYYTRRLLLQT
jgi:hypothetical protein